MTDTTDVDVDALLAEILLTPEGKSNPYPRYAAVREAGAAHRTALGVVVVTRYEDCQFVLRDARFGKGEYNTPWEQYGLTEDDWNRRFPDMERRTTSMLGLDPPDHTRLRRLVAKAFTPKTVEKLQPDIVQLADDLLDRFDTDVDIISELALPLPVAVIGEMLGIPVADRVTLQPHIRSAVKTLEFNPPLEVLEEASAATMFIAQHLEGLIETRRIAPTDDLLSQLVHVEEQGDQLTHDELIGTIMLLFGAGFETTTNLIGNGLLALLDHPDEMRRLRDDPALMKTAVEEMLRFDAPIQLDGRKVFEDLDLHGVAIAADEEVITLLGAANRDPRVYDDPDRFDVGRVAPAPMSFGAGIHYCLGAALARAEGYVVFGRLLARYPIIEPAWGRRVPRTAIHLCCMASSRSQYMSRNAPSHLPTPDDLARWPTFTPENPLPLLVSACITGTACGSDATAYGAPYVHTDRLIQLPNVRAVSFCPEDFAFGTPRRIPDIHGGNGFDVLDGRARVLSESGDDWTDPMLAAADEMLRRAQHERVQLALLMDISAACGSQVIYLGDRRKGVYQTGQGVCAALLIRNGIPVCSQRDYRTLGHVVHALDRTIPLDADARDHDESPWYVETFAP